ncbi:DinB family protein [Singulisphaera sp. PoT]|uniref:DinB family protein n=1 Tax=Singulisphaera sp. PoT TaxID=3411797 RepID=UPI003BF560A2
MATLLAVDLGLRTGLATFDGDGRLIGYRSQHFANREALRRGVHGILSGFADLGFLVLEGGGPIAEVWSRAAKHRGIATRSISAEDWRVDLFHAKDIRGRDRAKRSADSLARRVIEWSGAPRATSLRHDAAEAIGIGFWAVLSLGWLDRIPPEVLALTHKSWIPARSHDNGVMLMHDDFVSLYNYNRWANARMLGACRALSPDQYQAEPHPGWSSIQSSLYHIAVVEEGWLRGLSGENVQSSPTAEQLGTVDAVADWLERAASHVSAFLESATPESLETPITLRRATRSATLPPWVVLRHVVNHSTYHRGQIASKLKAFGIEQPATDFIYWAFEQIPQTR